MKYGMLLILALLTGCMIYPPQTERVDVVVRNPGNVPIEISASVGVLGRTVTIKPGAVEVFWFPRKMIPGRLVIKVESKEP